MKKRMWSGSLAAVLVSAGVLAAAPLTVMADDKIPQGITIGDINLGGLTEEEAKKKIDDHVKGLSKQTITLDVEGSDAVATAEELGFYWNNSEQVAEAAGTAVAGNLVARYMKSKDLEVNPISIPLEIAVDQEKVSAFVAAKCEGLAGEPQNATIAREDGTFVITPGVSGRAVNVEETTKALNDALAKGFDKPVEITAIVEEREPGIKESDLATIQDVLGTFSTDFSSSGAARSKNLQVGSAKINGTLLMPGETLSGYECMAPFSTANGYYTAAAYENGQVVDSIGGGVCQIATTLYNTALNAELEITERQNHSMTVAYVKPSMDAAIAGTFKDIKVTNNYSTPIYVEGGTDGRTLTFTVYGKETRSGNREVKYVSETLGVSSPGEPTTKVDPSLAPGARRQVQSAHRGLRSRLWKVVYVDGVETEKTLLHTDNYMASKAVVLVGPDAPAAAVPLPVMTDPVAETPAPIPETQAPVEGVNGGPGATQAPPAETAAPQPAPEPAPVAAAPEPAPVPEAPGE